MKKLIFFCIICLFTSKITAQRAKVSQVFSLGAAFNSGKIIPTFSFGEQLHIGHNYRLAIGSGIRATIFSAKGSTFTGLKSPYLSTTVTPLVSENMFILNAPISAEYQGDKIVAGFNIDLIGLTFGRSKDSLAFNNYRGSTDNLSVKPTQFNFALGSAGSTNSEIYVGFRIREEITIKAGVSFLFTKLNLRSTTNEQITKLGDFGHSMNAIPFINFVFNFEK
ncbi:MAG: hypothetical protein ACOVO2_15335 [Emticicia sp.]|uniref:hypothetical protein n=1 Tax=Emticicia sp. TaxID=1930953 RepID=UPI003BA6D5DA